MSAVKERLIGAVTVMDEKMAERLWNIILSDFSSEWDGIPEEEPDEWDQEMLADIENDPDCHSFTAEDQIDWGDTGRGNL